MFLLCLPFLKLKRKKKETTENDIEQAKHMIFRMKETYIDVLSLKKAKFKNYQKNEEPRKRFSLERIPSIDTGRKEV